MAKKKHKKGKDGMLDKMHVHHNKAHGLPADVFGHGGAPYGKGHGQELSHAHASEVSEGGPHPVGGGMADNANEEGETNGAEMDNDMGDAGY